MGAIADTGATVSIGGNRNAFVALFPCLIAVLCANNKKMWAKWRGTMVICHERKVIVVPNALYIPDVPTLISVDQLTRLGYKLLFHRHGIDFYKSGQSTSDKPHFSTTRKLSSKLFHINVNLLKLALRAKRKTATQELRQFS